MVDYTFGPQPAVDITTARLVTQEGLSGSLYASEASAQSQTDPLTVTVAGGLSATVIGVSAFGQLPEFTVADLYQVWWRSGDVIVHLMAFDGLVANVGSLEASAVAAQAAAEEAMTDAVRSVNGITPDATGNVQVQTGGTGGATAHSQLSGLGSDDHPQYLTAARGDTRYYNRAAVDTAVAAAATSASAADRNRSNHTGQQAQSTVIGLDSALISRLVVVQVATGSETRPISGGTVLWVSPLGLTPANRLPSDLVMLGAGSGGGDVSAPTTPSGLNYSNVSSSGFSVAWNASGDDVGVTGYDVEVNGVVLASPVGTSATISGRASNTAHVVRVRAKDASGKTSSYSSSVTVTTSPSGSSPTHSVFGATAFGGRIVSSYSDGVTPTRLATSFYRLGAGTNGWTCTGGRLWIPAGASLPSTVTLFAYAPGTTNPDLGATPLWSEEVAIPGTGQWVEATWDSPIPMDAGVPIFIGYSFGNTQYLHTPSPGGDPTPATDGSTIYESANAEATWARSAIKLGAAATSTSTAVYGIDIIVTEA